MQYSFRCNVPFSYAATENVPEKREICPQWRQTLLLYTSVKILCFADRLPFYPRESELSAKLSPSLGDHQLYLEWTVAAADLVCLLLQRRSVGATHRARACRSCTTAAISSCNHSGRNMRLLSTPTPVFRRADVGHYKSAKVIPCFFRWSCQYLLS